MFDLDLTKYRMVDLSYEVTPNQPGDRPLIMERGFLADRAFKYDITETHSHVGTHVESPAHFFEGGKDFTQFPLTNFFGRAVLAEVDDAKAVFEITPEHLESDVGAILREGDILLFRNNDRDSLAAGGEALPYLTPAAAQWMADRRIKLLGVDNYVRLACDIESGRELHDILMREDICFVEWLDNLNQLRRKEFFFMALPWKVQVMDSSWARAVAIEEL
jgi:kynurenine formamidase